MVGNLSHVVTEINSTANQLSSSAELLSAVTHETNLGMDKQLSETEQVAQGANKANSATGEMSDLAHQLEDVISQFKIG